LIAKEKVLGVLSLYTNHEHEFSKEESEFLDTLAGQAAIAIHNAQLHEQTKKQHLALIEQERIQRILKELSQDITKMDVDALLEKLTSHDTRSLQGRYLRRALSRRRQMGQHYRRQRSTRPAPA
jgi:GAF domain-containing protein